MAQAKPFTWYGEDAPAFKGQLADTTAHVIDSFASEGGVEPGTLVMRGTDTSKQVKQINADTDSAKAIGIAVHVHKEPETPYYPTGYSVPVITFGDVYVEAGADVKAGDTVAIKTNGEHVDYVASSTDEAKALTGFTYLDSVSQGEIVRVRVRQ